MGNLLQNFISKPTLFSVLCLLIILIGIPLALYWYTLGAHEEKLGAVYLSFLIFISICILFLDRIFVSFMTPLSLSIGELVLGLLLFFLFSFLTRKIVVDLQDYPHNYFMVVLNDGTKANTPLRYSFPFNKSAQLNGRHIVLEPSIQDRYSLKVKQDKYWGTLSKRVRELDGVEVIFQNNFLENFDDSKIDSLIRAELNPQPQ